MITDGNEFEKKAQDAGVSLRDVCRRSGVALSTFFHWKGGYHSPRMNTIQRLNDALDAEIQKRAA